MKYICGNVKNCPEQFKKTCDHSKPHKYTEKGCGNVRCARLSAKMTPEQWKEVGKGKVLKQGADCSCVKAE